MRAFYEAVEEAARELYLRALKDIPADVRAALQRGLDAEKRDGNASAEQVMFTILENVRTADAQDTLVCQDTGLPVFKAVIGEDLMINGGELKRRLRRGCERATKEYPLRSNTVHPVTRKHTGTNTGDGIPVVKIEFREGSSALYLCAAPKGSGSENMSFLKMLNPSEGLQGVKRYVLECVLESGAKPCPPVIVGVGLGGTSDVAMALAKEASCFRKIGTRNADPVIAELEAWLLDRINRTGLGPQGLGGATTALAVHVEWAHTHISHNPVAVNMQCWRGERAEAVINGAGEVRFL
ncbi:MAG: fumarate hydratase [Acidobacteria bacterium]|nr:fumarate hydratase [Acidobacteriota bacterium]